jgi:hypothetical protein
MRHFQATLHGSASVSDAFITSRSSQTADLNKFHINIKMSAATKSSMGHFSLTKKKKSEDKDSRGGKSRKIKIARKVCIRVDSARFFATVVRLELKDHQTAAGN